MPASILKKSDLARLAISALASLLFHLFTLLLYGTFDRPAQTPAVVRRFQAQQSTPSQRFNGASSPDELQAQMERLAASGQPLAAPELETGRIPTPGLTPGTQALSEKPADKGDALLPAPPSTEEETRPYVEAGPMAKNDEFAMDLIDLQTLAQSGRFKAAIIIDEEGLERPEGFINFTHILLDGTTDSYRIEDLARYMRDNTSIMARARGMAVRGFSRETLLEDPIHFLFPGPLRGRASSTNRIFLDEDESERLGRYLTGGGFLLVDAGDTPDDHWFLKEALRQIRRALKNRGEVVELPLDHPIYSAYYEFGDGFPGETKRDVMRFAPGLGNPWFYPARTPCMGTLRGLWGVESEGNLVAVLSDLDLRRKWVGERLPGDSPPCEDETQEEGGEEDAADAGETVVRTPYLQAATNIVSYALTRPGGLAVRLAPFAWKKRVKPRKTTRPD